jgi:hypothetical protein
VVAGHASFQLLPRRLAPRSHSVSTCVSFRAYSTPNCAQKVVVVIVEARVDKKYFIILG